jgi:monoamine oxidase
MTGPTPSSGTQDPLDVAVVGGGVSGLYAAWRIITDAEERGEPVPSVAIYEMSERVGGRLLTWLPEGRAAGLRAELGGMRFLPPQELVWNLIGRLGLKDQIIDFPVTGPNLRLLLRGVSTRADTPTPGARYELPPDQQAAQPADLMAAVITEILQTSENTAVREKYIGGRMPTSREDWDAVKPYLTWRGTLLWDLGFWNLISDVRSPEFYAYVGDAFGYFSLSSNWNAAEAMQFLYLDFLDKPQYKTLTGGYSQVPLTLESAIAPKCRIELNTRLASFDLDENLAPRLSLVGPQGPYEVTAERLLLAMPRRALELLGTTPSFDLQGNAELGQLVRSVTPYPAFKLFLFYESRWWEERFMITVGRSVSDLPIRQTYYMPPDPPHDGGPVPPYGLLMASYDDARAVDYWQGLVPREDTLEQGRAELREAVEGLLHGAGVLDRGQTVVDPPPNLHKATDDMVRHATDQLALLHDMPAEEIPAPVVGAFADWGLDPYGGGWNFWTPQTDVLDAMTRIKAPLGPYRRVNVIGDGYSGAAGWVEGALTATEVVLESHLGLSRPKWLPESYYLGW